MPEDIATLKERNARVEANKAWETSITRRSIITIGTYVIIGSYLTFLNIEQAWLHALVPPAAYIISTLSLPFLKGLWIKHIYKTKEVSS